MGVPLRTLYGQTELLGAYTLHPAGEVDPDTTGVPMADDIEIRIDNPDANGVGEIVMRHPNMFLGYYKNEEASAADLRTAGCIPAMPAISTTTGSSSSSTASRISPRPRAASASRRNTSRTS